MEKRVAILGINGGFGRLFSGLLFGEKQLTITGVDLASEPDPCAKFSKYIKADLGIANGEVSLLVAASDIIIICLPETVAHTFLALYKPHISRAALLIDTLSIKREVSLIYVENDFNALSLNPMFGPDLDIEGKNIIAITFRQTPLSKWFIALLEAWNLNVVYLSAEQHDKISSLIQVATHAAIMSFGITLNNFDVPLSQLLKIATPPFYSISALFGRIVSGNKNVYWNIQNENGYASAMRKELISNLIALDKCIDEGRQEDFNELIDPKTEDQKKAIKQLSDHFLLLFNQKSSNK
jgi:4-amino-4-deoxyprephenate dehydrogenase